jgi:hypothetical protein
LAAGTPVAVAAVATAAAAVVASGYTLFVRLVIVH